MIQQFQSQWVSEDLLKISKSIDFQRLWFLIFTKSMDFWGLVKIYKVNGFPKTCKIPLLFLILSQLAHRGESGERKKEWGSLIDYNNSLVTYTNIRDILGKICEVSNDVMSDLWLHV